MSSPRFPLPRRPGRERQGSSRGLGPGAAPGPRASSPGPGEQPPAPSRASGLLTWLRELLLVVVVALILSLLVKTFLLQPFWIPSGSMENTLDIGDRVIVSKIDPGGLQRGDVIVFTDPGGWLHQPVAQHGPLVHALQFIGLYPAGDNHLIKRIIGMPGDHVVCCTAKGLLTVNGTPIHEPYVKPGDPPSTVRFDITVPPGKVWVMGDNRSNSADSRFHDDGTGRTGSVPESDVTGRAIAIVWPFDRISRLSNYSSTFAKVPNR